MLPRRRMRGFLNVACFTRDRSSVAASIYNTKLLCEVIRLEAAHLPPEFHTTPYAKSRALMRGMDVMGLGSGLTRTRISVS